MELVLSNNFLEMNEMETLFIEGGFSFEEMGEAIIAGAISGSIGGAIAGGTATVGVMTLPGWAAGGISGGIVGGASYCIGELVNAAFGK